VELEDAAIGINQAPLLGQNSSDLSFNFNSWRGRFGENNERIFVNPFLTDANDFYLFDVSGNVPLCEVGFLMGQENPQVIESSPIGTDEAFSNDRIVYRLRHEYEAAVLDYRGMYKGVVV
jgi:hypothetical protein